MTDHEETFSPGARVAYVGGVYTFPDGSCGTVVGPSQYGSYIDVTMDDHATYFADEANDGTAPFEPSELRFLSDGAG